MNKLETLPSIKEKPSSGMKTYSDYYSLVNKPKKTILRQKEQKLRIQPRNRSEENSPYKLLVNGNLLQTPKSRIKTAKGVLELININLKFLEILPLEK